MRDANPLVADTHIRRVDRRATEVVGRDAVAFNVGEDGRTVLVGHHGAEGPHQVECPIESCLGRRADREPDPAGLVAAFAGMEPFEAETPAGAVHGIEGVGHHALVEQVAFHLHRL